MVANKGVNFLETMAEEIRIIYNSDISRAELLIENYLGQKLKDSSSGEKMELMYGLTEQFKGRDPENGKIVNFKSKEFSSLFSLLLGKETLKTDLSDAELSEKLAKSLNTLFDTLNKIISVIQSSLFGGGDKFETIRHVIGADLDKEEGKDSLQSYLDQIRKAFLISHKAFQQAANVKVKQFLDELDPDRISETAKGGLKFGALRRAGLFDIYKDKFQSCKSWFDSGRFTEEMLREFEKICQKLYKMEKRGA